jgi:hypothetical protein
MSSTLNERHLRGSLAGPNRFSMCDAIEPLEITKRDSGIYS